MKEKESEPMSQWKFNNFETDIDFTDADFMEKFEGCYEKMMSQAAGGLPGAILSFRD